MTIYCKRALGKKWLLVRGGAAGGSSPSDGTKDGGSARAASRGRAPGPQGGQSAGRGGPGPFGGQSGGGAHSPPLPPPPPPPRPPPGGAFSALVLARGRRLEMAVGRRGGWGAERRSGEVAGRRPSPAPPRMQAAAILRAPAPQQTLQALRTRKSARWREREPFHRTKAAARSPPRGRSHHRGEAETFPKMAAVVQGGAGGGFRSRRPGLRQGGAKRADRPLPHGGGAGTRRAREREGNRARGGRWGRALREAASRARVARASVLRGRELSACSHPPPLFCLNRLDGSHPN